MAELVTIRPRAGSKRFRAIKGITQFQKVTEQGQDVDRSVGEYKSERFPNSRQMFRPMWSASKRKWLLRGFEDMNQEKQKELDALVVKCKLKYGDKDPRARNYIKEADIYDANDPFFTHPSLKIITYEGQATLDKSRPLDQILLLGLQANVTFQKGGDKVNPVLSQRVKYVITDKNVDSKIKQDKRKKILTATKLYDALTDAKKTKVAMAMGLISNDNVDRSVIDEILWEACQDDTKVVDNNMTRQDLFIKMCKTNAAELNTRNMIQKAKATGKLRRNKTQGWLLFGESIGRTDNQVYEYFNNPDNQEMLIRLEQAMEDD